MQSHFLIAMRCVIFFKTKAADEAGGGAAKKSSHSNLTLHILSHSQTYSDASMNSIPFLSVALFSLDVWTCLTRHAPAALSCSCRFPWKTDIATACSLFSWVAVFGLALHGKQTGLRWLRRRNMATGIVYTYLTHCGCEALWIDGLLCFYSYRL